MKIELTDTDIKQIINKARRMAMHGVLYSEFESEIIVPHKQCLFAVRCTRSVDDIVDGKYELAVHAVESIIINTAKIYTTKIDDVDDSTADCPICHSPVAKLRLNK